MKDFGYKLIDGIYCGFLKKKVCHGLMTHLFIFYLSFLNILSTTIAMAPSPVTLQAVPKLSIAI